MLASVIDKLVIEFTDYLPGIFVRGPPGQQEAMAAPKIAEKISIIFIPSQFEYLLDHFEGGYKLAPSRPSFVNLSGVSMSLFTVSGAKHSPH